jgi:hypothetical protein
MRANVVWMHYCGGVDVLPEALVIEALQERGLTPLRANGIPRSGAGIIFFDRDSTDLLHCLRE